MMNGRICGIRGKFLMGLCVLACSGWGAATRAQTPTAGAPSPTNLVARCEALNELDLEQVADSPGRIVSTSMQTDRRSTAPERVMHVKRGHSQGNPTLAFETLPPHCRVEGYVTPHVRFYIALPPPDKWNERFMLAACDAWCGKLHEEITVPGLAGGYATLTNDGGHYSRAPFDGIWAHRDMDARINFAHRANHVTAAVGKAIAAAYYGRAPKRSYLAGFSKGGNAGLFAAQRYPADFDGIFVKAPVVHYNPKNAAHFPWIALAVHPDGKTPLLYAEKIPLLDKAVVDACDAIDGLKDRVIDDPRRCRFDPAVLSCKAGQSEAKHECLNAEQVTAVRKIYAKPVNARGEMYFEYPTDLSSERDWARAILPVRGSTELPFALTGAATGLRYMVVENNPGPGYDWRQFDFVAEKARIEAMSRHLDPDSLDMTAFKQRGGKLIIVHGWSDAMISARMTIDWFERMQKAMGGAAATGEFAQLYIVPGMHHGSGGAGPYVFDSQSALVRWVEDGVAPNELMLEDEPGTVPFRRRPVYPYPAFARYKGKGDPNLASSFVRVGVKPGR
jgi:hypothetical protein